LLQQKVGKEAPTRHTKRIACQYNSASVYGLVDDAKHAMHAWHAQDTDYLIDSLRHWQSSIPWN